MTISDSNTISNTMTEAITPGTETQQRRVPRVLWTLPIAAVLLAGMVTYRKLRPPSPPVSPDVLAATVRPVPMLYELLDQRSQLVRLKTYIGRHKLLIVFVKTPGRNVSQPGALPTSTANDSRKSPPPTVASTAEESSLLQNIRRDFAQIQQTGAILHVVSDTTPWNNRLKEERDQHFPFAILSDLDGSVHRNWGAFDSRQEQILEAVCVVDRRGFVKRTFLGPDHLGTTEEWLAALK